MFLSEVEQADERLVAVSTRPAEAPHLQAPPNGREENESHLKKHFKVRSVERDERRRRMNKRRGAGTEGFRSGPAPGARSVLWSVHFHTRTAGGGGFDLVRG